MTLPWLMVIVVIVTAALLIFIVTLLARYLNRAKRHDGHIIPDTPEEGVDVTVYAYDRGVRGLDDINAMHIGVYRDTGVITGIEDDRRVYQGTFEHTADNDRELGFIVRGAAEVKRITDTTVLYFFKRLRPMKIKSRPVQGLYDCINRGLGDNRPMVLRMTKYGLGDNDNG